MHDLVGVLAFVTDRSGEAPSIDREYPLAQPDINCLISRISKTDVTAGFGVGMRDGHRLYREEARRTVLWDVEASGPSGTPARSFLVIVVVWSVEQHVRTECRTRSLPSAYVFCAYIKARSPRSPLPASLWCRRRCEQRTKPGSGEAHATTDVWILWRRP